MHDIVVWIQNLPVSIWMREAFWPFPTILTIHVFSMGLVSGVGIATGLRTFGVGGGTAISRWARFAAVSNIAVVIVILSGIGLFMTYPAKAITNPLFFIKLAAMAVALVITAWLTRRMRADVDIEGLRLSGVSLIVLWVFVIFAGRFLAYTYNFINLLWYPQ